MEMCYKDSRLMKIMITLDNKFHKEVENVDALHHNTSCDTEFLQKYLKVYIAWVNYMNIPEDHFFKAYYLRTLIDLLLTIRSDWEDGDGEFLSY